MKLTRWNCSASQAEYFTDFWKTLTYDKNWPCYWRAKLIKSELLEKIEVMIGSLTFFEKNKSVGVQP